MPTLPLQIRCERFPVLTETFVANEARALAELGHDVTVHAHMRGDGGPPAHEVRVTYREDETTTQRLGALVRLVLRHPVGVLRDIATRHRWRREEAVAPLRVLAPALLRDRGSHLHVHFAKASALDALRGRHITGTPFSLTAHAYDIYAQPANLAAKLHGAGMVTTGCEYTARHLRVIEPRARVEVVVMGVDTDEYRRTTPHPERRVVVAIGRLVEKKGFTNLIRAAADPALRGLVDEVRIVGDGPLRDALEREIRRLDLADTVRMLGALPPDAVRAELEQAAVLAMPCVIATDGDRDSMPVVVKEALAMEVPVVVSDEVGLPEIVRPAFGRLVAPAAPAALAQELAQILGLSAAERAAMGRAGREHVSKHADLRIETRRLSELIEAT